MACQPPRPGPMSSAPRSSTRRTSLAMSSVPWSRWARTGPSGSPGAGRAAGAVSPRRRATCRRTRGPARPPTDRRAGRARTRPPGREPPRGSRCTPAPCDCGVPRARWSAAVSRGRRLHHAERQSTGRQQRPPAVVRRDEPPRPARQRARRWRPARSLSRSRCTARGPSISCRWRYDVPCGGSKLRSSGWPCHGAPPASPALRSRTGTPPRAARGGRR